VAPAPEVPTPVAPAPEAPTPIVTPTPTVTPDPVAPAPEIVIPDLADNSTTTEVPTPTGVESGNSTIPTPTGVESGNYTAPTPKGGKGGKGKKQAPTILPVATNVTNSTVASNVTTPAPSGALDSRTDRKNTTSHGKASRGGKAPSTASPSGDSVTTPIPTKY
jgi:hypothetical protein